MGHKPGRHWPVIKGQGFKEGGFEVLLVDGKPCSPYLIKSAPNLLEACEALLGEFEKFSRYGSPMAHAANGPMQMARAAIAAAKGG